MFGLCPPLAAVNGSFNRACMIAHATSAWLTAACKSTLSFFINKGQWRDACEQLPRWVFVKGERVTGLERRRANELAYCLRGV